MSVDEVTRRYSEADFLPLSGLQHMVFCDRQAALIHVEGIWSDNAFTVEGAHLHRVVDEGGARTREGTTSLRGVQIRSYRLGLSGKADVIELTPASNPLGGVNLPGLRGYWQLAPVEFKRGQPKAHRADEVQLCAQAMCLEEEFGTAIPEGRLYYGATRRRTHVKLSSELRELTSNVARAFHELVRSGRTPLRYRERKCERCSLFSACLPQKRTRGKSARAFLDAWLAEERIRDDDS